ncbi:hypothetical protein [Isoptericola sp. AK164]|uniref:DUF7937 domain-containing protein n=1 Tax=Isoptericola sp. AK164 TaxID=3024246 RepID=UPI0024187832|nr:hypothetical protein [Isoptericola sp. AK164]
MSDVVVVEQRRSPFAGVPTREIVRDVVAVVALLVALPLPWAIVTLRGVDGAVAARGSDLLWVVLATVAAVVVIVATYADRAGVLTGGWKRLAAPTARWWGLAPYGLVTLLYLVLDLVRASADTGAVGGGLAVGLAGAVLAAAVPDVRLMTGAAVVVAVGAVATPVLTLVDGVAWPDVVGSALGALLVLGLLWATARRFLRGDDAAGVVLLVLGAAVAVEVTMLGGGAVGVWLESVHGLRFGLLLLPAVAATAVVPVLARWDAVVGEPVVATASRWIRVAVQAFELMLLVAAFVVVVAVVQLVAGRIEVEPVLRLIVGVLVVVVALLARRALLRDPRGGHATAVGAACVVVVLGVVILVARAGIGTASRVEELLLALALPALVLAALIVPPSVATFLAADPQGSAQPVPGRPQQPFGAQPGYAQPGYAEPAQPAQPAHPGYAEAAQPEPAQPEPAQAAETEPGSRWRGTWAAGTDATQQMSPVRSAATGEQPSAHGAPSVADATAVQQPVQQGAAPAESTQMLPPVTHVPGSPWTPEQALDPHTPLEQLAQIVQEAPHLRPHVAANPSTYPALLDWLGALGDPSVDAALRTRR